MTDEDYTLLRAAVNAARSDGCKSKTDLILSMSRRGWGSGQIDRAIDVWASIGKPPGGN